MNRSGANAVSMRLSTEALGQRRNERRQGQGQNAVGVRVEAPLAPRGTDVDRTL